MGQTGAEAFLRSRERLGIKLGLKNMRWAVARLGHPERDFPAVLVAGSKGKGSCAALLESVLRAGGCRTGLYTSPHLVGVRERIRIDGRAISPRALGRLISRMRKVLGDGSPLTYFEWVTAAALCTFSERRVDLAVLEVGMGGRLDATNVVPGILSVITEIEKEHGEHLGTRLGDIAREKAGILRPGGELVTGVGRPAALRALSRAAAEQGVRVFQVRRCASWEIRRHTTRGLLVDLATPEGRRRGLRVGLLGRHQALNAATAVVAVERLSEHGFHLDAASLRRGLAAVRWPGRCDYRPGAPGLLLDGAHTPESARALGALLDELFGGLRRVLLFGALRDKEIGRIAGILFPRVSRVVLTSPPGERGAPPGRMLRAVSPRLRGRCVTAAEAAGAFDLARREAGRAGLVVVTGSLHLVGAVMSLQGKDGLGAYDLCSPDHSGTPGEAGGATGLCAR